MTQTPSYLLTLAQYGVNIAFWASMAFLLLIGAVWPWWKSFWGMNIIFLEIAISLALVGPVLSADFHIYVINGAISAWVVVTSLWLVGAIVIWRGFLVMSAQLKGTYGTGIRALARQVTYRVTRRSGRHVRGSSGTVADASAQQKIPCEQDGTLP